MVCCWSDWLRVHWFGSGRFTLAPGVAFWVGGLSEFGINWSSCLAWCFCFVFVLFFLHFSDLCGGYGMDPNHNFSNFSIPVLPDWFCWPFGVHLGFVIPFSEGLYGCWFLQLLCNFLVVFGNRWGRSSFRCLFECGDRLPRTLVNCDKLSHFQLLAFSVQWDTEVFVRFLSSWCAALKAN